MSIIVDGKDMSYIAIDEVDMFDGNSGYIEINEEKYYYGVFRTPRVDLTETTGFNSSGYIYNDNPFDVYVHTKKSGSSTWNNGGFGWPSSLGANSNVYSGSNNVSDSHDVRFSVIYPAGQRVYSFVTYVDENDSSEQKGTQGSFETAEERAGIV